MFIFVFSRPFYLMVLFSSHCSVSARSSFLLALKDLDGWLVSCSAEHTHLGLTVSPQQTQAVSLILLRKSSGIWACVHQPSEWLENWLFQILGAPHKNNAETQCVSFVCLYLCARDVSSFSCAHLCILTILTDRCKIVH